MGTELIFISEYISHGDFYLRNAVRGSPGSLNIPRLDCSGCAESWMKSTRWNHDNFVYSPVYRGLSLSPNFPSEILPRFVKEFHRRGCVPLPFYNSVPLWRYIALEVPVKKNFGRATNFSMYSS